MRWLRKAWGEFVGPEATAVDNTIALSLGALGAVIAPTPILRLAAADLWGGVWANNTKVGPLRLPDGIDGGDTPPPPSTAAPWFAPVYYSKLLLGHASSALWPDSTLRD
jgi:hypothetical protein